jgi:hopanoid biosynthesis associated protein HpnK
LPPKKIPDLVGVDGLLRNDLLMTGISFLFPSTVREQVAAEITAQFEAFQATGLALDHVNAHHHFHLHPWVAGPLFDIGPHYGMRSVRVPYEPILVLQSAEPSAQLRSDWVVGACARRLRTRARQCNVNAPDQVFGLAWSGAMTQQRIEGILRNLPDGVSEIYVHPATRNDFTAAARGYRYVDEFMALTASSVAELMRASGVRTGGFHDLIAL